VVDLDQENLLFGILVAVVEGELRIRIVHSVRIIVHVLQFVLRAMSRFNVGSSGLANQYLTSPNSILDRARFRLRLIGARNRSPMGKNEQTQ